jgi:hypothetical protein
MTVNGIIQFLLISAFTFYVMGANRCDTSDNTCNSDDSVAFWGGLLAPYIVTTNLYLYEIRGKYFGPNGISVTDMHAVILIAFAFGIGLGAGQVLYGNKTYQNPEKESKTVECGQPASFVTISLPVRPQSSQ